MAVVRQLERQFGNVLGRVAEGFVLAGVAGAGLAGAAYAVERAAPPPPPPEHILKVEDVNDLWPNSRRPRPRVEVVSGVSGSSADQPRVIFHVPPAEEVTQPQGDKAPLSPEERKGPSLEVMHCDPHYWGRPFDQTEEGWQNKVAVVAGASGRLAFSPERPSEITNCRDYDAFIFPGEGDWQAAGLECADNGSIRFISLDNVAFTEARDYLLAVALMPKEGKTLTNYYCEEAVVQAYEEERAVTESGWIGLEIKLFSPFVLSRRVWSPTGRDIAGLSYRVTGFERNSINPCPDLPPTFGWRDCGYYQMDPGHPVVESGFFIRQGFVYQQGLQPEVVFKMVTDQRENCDGICSVKGGIASNEDMVLFTRDRDVLPPEAAPPLPLRQFGRPYRIFFPYLR